MVSRRDEPTGSGPLILRMARFLPHIHQKDESHGGLESDDRRPALISRRGTEIHAEYTVAWIRTCRDEDVQIRKRHGEHSISSDSDSGSGDRKDGKMAGEFVSAMESTAQLSWNVKLTLYRRFKISTKV